MCAERISDAKLNHIAELIGALDRADLRVNESQAIITNHELACRVVDDIRRRIETFRLMSLVEDMGSFPLVVPGGYDHKTALADFDKRASGLSMRHERLTDANFSNASTVLTPGRRFRVKMLAVKPGSRVSSEDCLKILALYKGVLTSAQGATLVYEQARKHLSIPGKFFLSLDEKERLSFPDESYYEIAGLSTGSGEFIAWYVCAFHSMQDNRVLLCFCDED